MNDLHDTLGEKKRGEENGGKHKKEKNFEKIRVHSKWPTF